MSKAEGEKDPALLASGKCLGRGTLSGHFEFPHCTASRFEKYLLRSSTSNVSS